MPWNFVTRTMKFAPKLRASSSMLIGHCSRRAVERLCAAGDAGSGRISSEVRPSAESVEMNLLTWSGIASSDSMAVHGTTVSKIAYETPFSFTMVVSSSSTSGRGSGAFLSEESGRMEE